ncbi:Pro-resilin [Frankliniella fusca]|uniref:Pro-resilin n=1 Tax=Frankliniella fusca TaxID=407009 RepID=A0AAE1HDS1_9NEOP|nr:Pro-resilin [Frankliniella fusca]
MIGAECCREEEYEQENEEEEEKDEEEEHGDGGEVLPALRGRAAVLEALLALALAPALVGVVLAQYPPAGGPSNSYLPPAPGGGPKAPTASYGPPTGGPGPRPPSGGGANKPSGGYGPPGGGGGESAEPEPYSFEYEVKDDATGTDFSRKESSDGSTVTGEYQVLLPDGRRQMVKYTADDANGFVADVKYEGEAIPGPPGPGPQGGGGGRPSGGYGPPAPGGPGGRPGGGGGNGGYQY